MKKFINISVVLLFQFTGVYLFAQDYYTVTPLGGNNLTGGVINNNGQIAGTDETNYSAFIWENGSIFNIPDTRWGTDINSLGYVTGSSLQGSEVHAFLYTGNQMIFIPPISGTNAFGNGINDSGWVTGLTTVDQYNIGKHPFLYKDGNIIDLGTFGGSLSAGKKVNNTGWVVGYSFTTNGTSDDLKLPFIYKGNGLEQLQLLGNSDEGDANDINDAGEVCGFNLTLPDYRNQAVKWDSSGNVFSLEQLPNQRWSSAAGINNSGDVVGSIHVEGVGRFAVLWKGDSVAVLNNLIDPGLGIFLMDAYSINDLGEILCSQTVGSDIFYYVITPPNPTGIKNEKPVLPKEHTLYQNYPNPFNPSTRIKYAIGSRQYTSLKVYDVLGNEVATLVNEEKPAGEYEIEFNAKGLPSGVYFYQLKAGSFIGVKKMILLR